MTAANKPKIEITVEFVKANFRYDPESGLLCKVGKGELKPCLAKNDKGYVCVYVGNQRILVHRIAWALMTGSLPSTGIDHIDGDRENNRWLNLREATPTQNMCNSATKRKVNDLPRGVVPVKKVRSSFLARIQYKKRNITLGVFKSPEEASEVYQLAAEMLHGRFAYHLGQGAQTQQGTTP